MSPTSAYKVGPRSPIETKILNVCDQDHQRAIKQEKHAEKPSK
jgi:hypothetical protein